MRSFNNFPLLNRRCFFGTYFPRVSLDLFDVEVMTGVDTVNLTSSPVTVPFGVRDVVKYSRGQASAREYALSKGFALDTFVELAVQWGEQVRSTVHFFAPAISK